MYQEISRTNPELTQRQLSISASPESRSVPLRQGRSPDSSDRGRWHRPLISIVITHHNYSGHIEEALRSVLDQTYENWECVVVDDASDVFDRLAVTQIVEAIASPKVKLIMLNENVGQIPSFYAGLDATTGQFACLLDPDDRYAPTFLAEALAAHLNGVLFCPIVSTDQHLLLGGEVITGCYTGHKKRVLGIGNGMSEIPEQPPRRLLFFPSAMKGWHWSSTSGMMFRRRALNFLRPHKRLAYRGSADSYLAHGAHFLGGSLFLTMPLVYRGIHKKNAYLTDDVFAMGQDLKKVNGEARTRECIVDVMEAIKANGAGGDLVKAEKRTLGKRLKRSLLKRWRRLTGSKAT